MEKNEIESKYTQLMDEKSQGKSGMSIKVHRKRKSDSSNMFSIS